MKLKWELVMSKTEDKYIDDFNIDTELQSIADKITEYKLNFGGALFEKEDTKEEFVITVTKADFMHDLLDNNDRLTEENAKLREMLKAAVDDVDSYGEFTTYNHKKAKDLLSQLKDQNNDK